MNLRGFDSSHVGVICFIVAAVLAGATVSILFGLWPGIMSGVAVAVFAVGIIALQESLINNFVR